MTITLRSTREHVFKTHTNSVVIRFTARQDKDEAVCPVMSMHTWFMGSLSLGWMEPQQSVFPIGVESARKLPQTAASAVTGMPPVHFGLHSLRAGGATDADADGASIAAIMMKGRWRSPVVLQYMRGGDALARDMGIRMPSAGRTAVHDM